MYYSYQTYGSYHYCDEINYQFNNSMSNIDKLLCDIAIDVSNTNNDLYWHVNDVKSFKGIIVASLVLNSLTLFIIIIYTIYFIYNFIKNKNKNIQL